MSDPVISVDTSEVHAGKLEELKAAIKDLVGFVEENERDPIFYSVYFDEDGTRMTVVQVHPDSASMEFHMDVAASAFPRFSEFLTLSRIDIYGKPSDTLLEQLRRKAGMLGNATVVVHDLHAGFRRLDAE
jgi:hypothetical protein